MNTTFDITIIGSGPGGYSAAIRAAQLGYNVAIIEKYENLGGTCTNVGCIPSKALLDASENYYSLVTKFSNQGISADKIHLDFNQFQNRKNKVVQQNVSGLDFLMKKNNIRVFRGTASFLNDNEIQVLSSGQEAVFVKSNYFIIASGSKPSSIPGIKIDKKRIISSTEALSIKEIPQKLVIIGGGVIGVEMASIFSRIGTDVTIIEFKNRLIPSMDHDLGSALRKILKKKGVTILLNHSVNSVDYNADKVKVNFQNEDGIKENITTDYCLVSIGRSPYTKELGLSNTAVELDSKGKIITNDILQTEAPNIFAIGDVVKGPMLAHKAEEEGVFAVETINGQKPTIHYHLFPSVVYTWPEVASIGYTEEQLIEKGIEYNVGKFPFQASGRARASGDTEGFTKVLTEKKYGEVMGVHIIGARAADLIAQAVIGMHYEITEEDMFRISYAHPTFSETLKEAYLMSSGQGSLNL